MKIDQNIKDVVSEIGYTLSYLVGVACIISLFFTTATGCAASASADAKSGANADWTAAWKDGACQKSAGDAAYTACLEKSLEEAKKFPPPAPPQAEVPAPQESAPTPVLVARTEETKVVTPPQATPLSLMPGASIAEPQQLKFGSGGFIFVPVANGPRCDLPSNLKPLQMRIVNESKYLFEVRGRILPLNCEVGDKFIPARVLRKGKLEDTWVLKAGEAGKLVFLPFNGGLGDVDVQINALWDMGEGAPALPVGSVKRTFRIPSPDGKNWKWEVTPSMLKQI
ncbi:hypothetical protein KBC59_02455 [Patescibacteria group bacterium]|nr:hypothetical protein [Patescibacteria group bacterium]